MDIEEHLKHHLGKFDYDVRKSNDARFMDQKVTPDVLHIISDCVLTLDAGRNIEFTKDDIWKDEFFNTNVKHIFKKPNPQNQTTKREYDKFISQPLRTLAYSGVLSLRKENRSNKYKINDKEILEFISMKEINSIKFLYHFTKKVLVDSDFLKYFEEFENKCKAEKETKSDFRHLKEKFEMFMIGNTRINGKTEVRRIFPKILNIYSFMNNIPGTIKGGLSDRQIYKTDLIYNRVNWRDVCKDKCISRTEAQQAYENLIEDRNEAYSEYLIQKAINMIREKHKESEVKDEWATTGQATQVHHIFSKTKFPKISYYLENLIKLTPTQHYTMAHPRNNTQEIDPDYQLTCLLSKADSIEKSLRRGEFFYNKEAFVYVINTGLTANFRYDLNLSGIKSQLAQIYHAS